MINVEYQYNVCEQTIVLITRFARNDPIIAKERHTGNQ